MIISDWLFNLIRDLAEILPLVAALYLGLAQIWGLPKGDGVNDTLILIAGFLGALTQLLRTNYNKTAYKSSIEEDVETKVGEQ